MRSIRTRLAATALLCLLLSGVAHAQQPPKSPAARAEIAELTVGLRQEAIERALESVARRLDKAAAPEKAARVRAHRAVSRTFAEEHEGAELETTLRDFFSSALAKGQLEEDDLKVELDVFRGWRDGYKIRTVDAKLVPANVTAFEPSRSTGYPPEVAVLDGSVPHSMHDLGDYLADRFTRTALDRMVSSGRKVELHVGSEEEALADLHNRGWNVFGEVRAPNGTYERLFLAESPAGEVRYVVTGDVDGADRVRHLASILKLAGESREGVPAANVEVVGDVAATQARNLEAVKDALSHLGGEGSTAIVGFRMALRNELTKRALARAGAENLRSVLGADPYAGLVRGLRKERDAARGQERKKLDAALEAIDSSKKLAAGLAVEPADAFKSSKELAALLDAQKILVEVAKSVGSPTLDAILAGDALRLPGGASPTDVVATRSLDVGPLHADELTVKTAGGDRSLLLVNNYYGDALGTVVRGLLESGRRRIAYFGTAGGTTEGARIGDVHVPETILDQGLEKSGVANGFLAYFARLANDLGDRLKLGTLLGNVFSPLAETMGWLSRVRQRGVDAVEVENGYLAREVQRHNERAGLDDRAELITSVIVSDLPGTEQTLGNNNSLTSSTFGRMVDHYLAALGVDDVVLRAPRERVSQRPAADARDARVLEVAEKLVPRELARSSFLRDRLAEILASVDPKVLADVDATKKLKLESIAGLSPEVRARLEAEIAGAYTDKQLLASLERGNAVVSRLSQELREDFPAAKLSLRVGGGIERGAYSPVAGLVVEVLGSAPIKAEAAQILAKLEAEVPDARVRLGPAGEHALDLGRGEAFSNEPEPLVRLFEQHALDDAGVLFRGGSPEYVTAPSAVAAAPEVATARPATPGPSVSDLAGFTIPELLLRAQKVGKGDAALDRASLAAAITGRDPAAVARDLAAWDASHAKASGRPATTGVDRERVREATGLTDPIKKLVEERAKGGSDRGER